MSNYKHNIKTVLGRINSGDYEYFDSFTEEDIKALPPYVLFLWMQGAQNNKSIHTYLNASYVNPYIFSLSSHPHLLYRLMVYANSGNNTDFKFKKKTNQKREDLKPIMEHYGVSHENAEMIKNILSEESLNELQRIYNEMD